MNLIENYVINPDGYLKPDIKISPFTLNNFRSNIDIINSSSNFGSVDEYFQNRFSEMSFSYTINARQALSVALSKLNLKRDDIVTILTTSNNFYISSCVTKEIEKFCSWSRKLEQNSKVILVNHEFGFCYQELEVLKMYGLPIIEDCAHSFVSNNLEGSVGKVGDFVIYSFPKFFPIQIGGMLVSNSRYELEDNLSLSIKQYIQQILSFYIPKIHNIVADRVSNFQYLESKFTQIGSSPTFCLDRLSVPGVFMFNIVDCDLLKLKQYMHNNGIESSVFYGESSYFVPVNQSLNEYELDYIYNCVKSFLGK